MLPPLVQHPSGASVPLGLARFIELWFYVPTNQGSIAPGARTAPGRNASSTFSFSVHSVRVVYTA